MTDELPVEVFAVMRLWRQGFDTWHIATALGLPEAQAERLLHLGLEQHRNKLCRSALLPKS